MDEDWHAVCQAMYRGVEGAEWERSCTTGVWENKRSSQHLPPECQSQSRNVVVGQTLTESGHVSGRGPASGSRSGPYGIFCCGRMQELSARVC